VIDVPRISYDALPAQLREELAAKVKRLGYLGEFFQVAAHQPDALYHFNRFTEILKEALPHNLVELIALTLSTWSGNFYERVQHERLALMLGLSETWVKDVERLAPDTTTRLTPTEKAAQTLALSMANTQGRGARGDAEAFLKLTDHQTLVGVMLTVGRYLAHAAFCNTMQIKSPVASPFGDPS
jgi:alkylhydroperoxidase family enzyme